MPIPRLDNISISSPYETHVLGRLNNYYASKKTMPNYLKGEVLRRVAALALPVFKAMDFALDLALAYSLKGVYRIQQIKGLKNSTLFSFISEGEIMVLSDTYFNKCSEDFKDIYRSVASEMKHSSYEVQDAHHYDFDTHAVRIKYSPGRMGDCLLAYLKAKWVAHQHNIPLIFEPFKGSEKFALHQNEKYRFDETSVVQKFKKSKTWSNKQTIKEGKEKNLYEVNYHPEDPCEFHHFPKSWEVSVDWDDPNFHQVVQESLKPTCDVKFVDMPQHDASIALHVRQGKGFDADAFSYVFPLKLPPMEFYYEAVTKACEEYKNEGKKNLYIHLFTDHPNPEVLSKKFGPILAKFPDLNITLGLRKDAGAMDDMFSMTQFDTLIRSTSNFSLISGILGRPEKEFYPSAYQHNPKSGKLTITEMKAVYRKEKGGTVSSTEKSPLHVETKIPKKLQNIVKKLI